MASTSIPLRPLGKNGPMVPAMGLGLMTMAHKMYGNIPDDEERFALLDRAVELGETFWDTADMYGDCEDLLGKWFKRTGKRDQIFLATKFGYLQEPLFAIDSSGPYAKKACESSLKRLGVDSIDLYYLHNANPETPIEETMRALAELKAEGKIKHIGLSTVSSKAIRRAHKVAPVTAVQVEYSIYSREIEGEAGTNILSTCRELGIALVIQSPLSRGLLTPTFSKGETLSDGGSDARYQMMPRFVEENRRHNEGVIAQFQSMADKKGCSISQLALSWVLKQGEDVFPIPGTKHVKYLESNVASLEFPLTDEEEAEIRTFADENKIIGGVIPEAMESMLFVDTKEE